MKENRTKVIRARLSEEEKEQVFRRAKAEGVTLSMYLRKSVLGERITSKADIQTVFELKKIGTNLNQLAKHVLCKLIQISTYFFQFKDGLNIRF